MDDPKPLTRSDFQKFLPDLRAVRAFEKLFELVPSTLNDVASQIEQVEITADSATVTANNALASLASIARSLEYLAGAPAVVPQKVEDDYTPNTTPSSAPKADYVDFDMTAPRIYKQARLGWSADSDTLEINHAGGLKQKIGLHNYLQIPNTTAGVLLKNRAISFLSGSTYDYMDASSAGNALSIIGISTTDIPAGANGYICTLGKVENVDTTGAPFGETWVFGDVIYPSPTTPGNLTNVKPTAPNKCVPMAIVKIVSATVGEYFVRTTIEQNLSYAIAGRTTDATPTAANTALALTFSVLGPVSSGFTLGTPASRIVAQYAGLYSVSVSFQIESGSASTKTAWAWVRKNGVDIGNSAIKLTIASNSDIITASRSLTVSMAANDYVEMMFAADSTSIFLSASPATSFAPATPSAVVSIIQVQQ